MALAGKVMRTAFSAAEADEIRSLLDGLSAGGRAQRRIGIARLRHMGLGIAADSDVEPSRARFESEVSSGALKIDQAGSAARAVIEPNPAGNVFRVAVGVTGDSIPEDWDAFEQRYQWLGGQPRKVASGAHLFVLAVDRWRSAVVGLYEAISAGAERLPGSPNPERWPFALGVRPLAAIPPLNAIRVEGQIGPQSGLPARVYEPEDRERLYEAISRSPPPPGPRSLEHRVQELEWIDVVPDVIEAVRSLDKGARADDVIARAVDLGEWSAEELNARAWYTGSGATSHIERLLRQALDFEDGSMGRLLKAHGMYSLRDPSSGAFGSTYRPAGDHKSAAKEVPTKLADISELDRATARHMDLQDSLADALREHGIEPRSPLAWQPQFDLGFVRNGMHYVVEVKSGSPVSSQQVRLGTGQLLEYRHDLQNSGFNDVQAVLLVESDPPPPWGPLTEALSIGLLRADRLDDSISELLSSSP